MRFASSITQEKDPERAIAELLAPIDARVTPGMVDLVLIFATAHFDESLPRVLEALSDSFSTAVILGCTAEGTIGFDTEVERKPSMALLVGSMPDVRIHPFHIRREELESATTPDDWERIVAASPESKPTFVALADPFSIPVHDFLDRINDVYKAAQPDRTHSLEARPLARLYKVIFPAVESFLLPKNQQIAAIRPR